MVMLTFACAAFGLLFFTCEVGQRFSDEFDDICDVIEQFNWYAFPAQVQRMLPIIILAAQQPVAVECFGSIMCLRDTFKSVSTSKEKNSF